MVADFPQNASYTADPGKLIRVKSKNPTSPELKISLVDTVDDEGNLWYPSPGTTAYEKEVVRKGDHQPVFIGNLYTFEKEMYRFRVHSPNGLASVFLSREVSVALVDESAIAPLPTLSSEMATNLGCSAPMPRETRSELADSRPVLH
jgi:hypothetical protein